MRITITTSDGSYGCSEVAGDEDVSHALMVFSNAMVAAGFAQYPFVIDESYYEERERRNNAQKEEDTPCKDEPGFTAG